MNIRKQLGFTQDYFKFFYFFNASLSFSLSSIFKSDKPFPPSFAIIYLITLA